ncbi:MAG: hypothetical protein ACYCX6_13600 [Vulcanimicrobiaceae bacterium]
MLTTETAIEERLITLRALPDLAERALREGLRAAILGRHWRAYDRGGAVLRSVVLARFDALAGSLPLAAADRVRTRTEIAALADGFAISRLARRLLATPLSRVARSRSQRVDVVVCDRAGHRFAIRFARVRDAFHAAELAASAMRGEPAAAAVLVHDLLRGRTRRFPPASREVLRCA